MSFFKRIIRVFRSWLGLAVDSVESAELILQQNIRDLEAEVPKMNTQLAEIVAQKSLADAEFAKAKNHETDLLNKAKTALKANRRDIAQQYAVELEKLKPELQGKENTAKLANTALERAQNAKRIFVTEKDKKIQQAKAALSHKHQAEWNAKIADTLANFQVGSIDQTQDEMIRKIEEEAARSEAKLQLALNEKSGGLALIEEDASKLQADETLRQLEIQMGLASPVAQDIPEPAREKTMGVRERA